MADVTKETEKVTVEQHQELNDFGLYPGEKRIVTGGTDVMSEDLEKENGKPIEGLGPFGVKKVEVSLFGK